MGNPGEEEKNLKKRRGREGGNGDFRHDKKSQSVKNNNRWKSKKGEGIVVGPGLEKICEADSRRSCEWTHSLTLPQFDTHEILPFFRIFICFYVLYLYFIFSLTVLYVVFSKGKGCCRRQE